MILTEQTVLSLLHRRMGLPDPSVESGGSFTPDKFDKALLADFRLRYLEALERWPLVKELPYVDLWGDMNGEYVSPYQIVFDLPEICIRPVSLRLPEWDDDVREFEAAGSARHQRQRYGLLRADIRNPAVFIHADQLMVYGVSEGYKGERVYADTFRCIAAPADGSYIMPAGMLEEIVEELGISN